MTLTEHMASFVENNQQLSIIVYILGIIAMAMEVHINVSKEGEDAKRQIISFCVSLFFGFFWPPYIVYRLIQKTMILLRPN